MALTAKLRPKSEGEKLFRMKRNEYESSEFGGPHHCAEKYESMTELRRRANGDNGLLLRLRDCRAAGNVQAEGVESSWTARKSVDSAISEQTNPATETAANCSKPAISGAASSSVCRQSGTRYRGAICPGGRNANWRVLVSE